MPQKVERHDPHLHPLHPARRAARRSDGDRGGAAPAAKPFFVYPQAVHERPHPAGDGEPGHPQPAAPGPLRLADRVRSRASRSVAARQGRERPVGDMEVRFVGFDLQAEGNAMARWRRASRSRSAPTLEVTRGGKTDDGRGRSTASTRRPARWRRRRCRCPAAARSSSPASTPPTAPCSSRCSGDRRARRKLSVDVTRKPLIQLVWYGLYVVLAGGVLADGQPAARGAGAGARCSGRRSESAHAPTASRSASDLGQPGLADAPLGFGDRVGDAVPAHDPRARCRRSCTRPAGRGRAAGRSSRVDQVAALRVQHGCVPAVAAQRRHPERPPLQREERRDVRVAEEGHRHGEVRRRSRRRPRRRRRRCPRRAASRGRSPRPSSIWSGPCGRSRT